MGKVYVVHCVDAEGPLHESLPGTFERVRRLTGVEVEPSRENLAIIQEGKLPLGGHEEMAKLAFSKRFLHYNESWECLERMLEQVTSPEFRLAHADTEGNGWRFTYFVNDFVGFVSNPRGRDMGYHAILDRYREFYQTHKGSQGGDSFQWHTHAMPLRREAHRNATALLNSPHVWEVLARRILDRSSFPICFRAGFNAERPDWNWFLEQYIPFDFSNQAFQLTELDREQGVDSGRFGDWRRAPGDWRHYHPAHDDYQVEGSMNRMIFRCLNVGTRMRFMRQEDVDAAFARAAEGKDTVLAFMDHDFRNLAVDIEETYGLLQKAASVYSEVAWENATADVAARSCLGLDGRPLGMSVQMESGRNTIHIRTREESFGPSPFFCIRTKGGRYVVDNLDFQVPLHEWSYTFDEDTVPLENVDEIGIASNSRHGSGELLVLDARGTVLKKNAW